MLALAAWAACLSAVLTGGVELVVDGARVEVEGDEVAEAALLLGLVEITGGGVEAAGF